MTFRSLTLAAFAVTVVLAACGGNQVETVPAPVGPDPDSAARAEALARARADSIARAQAEADARRADEAARDRAIESARSTLEMQVYFDYDASEIRADQRALMREKAEILNASPQVQIRLEGHADERGSTEYNIALGNRRAVAIRDFLTGFGLAEARFSLVSFGEEQPADRGSGEAAWARNRRVEFRITAGANSINPPNRQ